MEQFGGKTGMCVEDRKRGHNDLFLFLFLCLERERGEGGGEEER